LSRTETTEPLPPPPCPPKLRCPDVPLPPYRYVPGLQPHPLKSPQGHMHLGSQPAAWHSGIEWREDLDFLRGCDLFDQRYLWEAHEAWEGIWHQVPTQDPYRLLLQGLIQAAAGVLKRHTEHSGPADLLHSRSCQKLRCVIESTGSPYRGLQLSELIERLQAFHSGGAWPTLPGARP
jgi:uncharacterized protein